MVNKNHSVENHSFQPVVCCLNHIKFLWLPTESVGNIDQVLLPSVAMTVTPWSCKIPTPDIFSPATWRPVGVASLPQAWSMDNHRQFLASGPKASKASKASKAPGPMMPVLLPAVLLSSLPGKLAATHGIRSGQRLSMVGMEPYD